MYQTLLALAFALFYLDAAVLVHAGLFVFQPAAGSICQAGHPCLISWVDDGSRPLLSAVGVSTVGLYTGKQKLVQTISPVDVTKSHSITFIPNAAAGPDSDSYYIAITSVGLKGNDSVPYAGWSPNFTLTGMKGSFDSPLAEATSSIAIPASLTKSSSSSSGTKTITVGVLHTAVPSPLVSSIPVSPSSHALSISAPLVSVTGTASRTLVASTAGFTTVTSSSLASSSTALSPASSSISTTSSTSKSSTSGSLGSASRFSPALAVLAMTFFTWFFLF